MQAETLTTLELESCDLSNSALPELASYLRNRIKKFETINLSKNRFTAQIKTLFSIDKVSNWKLSDNRIWSDFLLENAPYFKVRSLSLSRNKRENMPMQEFELNLQPYKTIVSLELAYHCMSIDTISYLLMEILDLRIPIRHLDLSGNDVGPFGCKFLNILG